MTHPIPSGWYARAVSRIRSLWRGLRHREAVEAEIAEEFSHHIALRAEELVRRGQSPEEAARQARLEFGNVEGLRDDARRARGLRGFDRIRLSWLDVKLGLRLLRKYPGLSVVSVAGIAVAVAVGAVGFGVIDTLTASDLPLHEGDRLVTIENQGGGGALTHLHDFRTWREELESVSALGAYRSGVRNIVVGEGGVSPGRIVEMTSSGFEIARVPPLLGRTLVTEDERPGAPDVAVIGFGPWQALFGGAPDVVGRTLRIGATTHTIVGVMPAGFAFPLNDRIWTPLRLEPNAFELGAAPPIEVFGRLGTGATVDRLKGELKLVRDRLAAQRPDVYDRIQPTAYGYGAPLGPWSWTLHLVQLLVTLILVVIAVNVASLVYARTATRAGEISVRAALGASRARIAWQLFSEGLVLSSAGALIGLLLARLALVRINGSAGFGGASGERPFWWDFDVSTRTVFYVVGLAILSAVIIGVVPALGATGRRLREGLQSVGARAPSPSLGRVWTALIVAQVVLAVAAVPVATNAIWQWGVSGLRGRDRAVDEIVNARLHLDPASPLQLDPAAAGRDDAADELDARYSALQAEVLRRVEVEPGVAYVVEMRPAPWEDPDLPILVAAAPPSTAAGIAEDASPSSYTGSLIQASHSPTMRLAGWSRVEPEYFSGMGLEALSGRLLQADDARTEAPAVVVSETFVQRVLDGAPAVGQWVRLAQTSQRWSGPVLLSDGSTRWGLGGGGETWFRIVGVVPDFPRMVSPYPPEPKVYQALPSGVADPLTLAIRLRGTSPERFERRLADLAAGIDPLLRVESFALGERIREGEVSARTLALVIASLAGSLLLLAVAGLYALVSFTVTRRRREIGIRLALGGRPDRILGRILSGVAWRLVIGIGLGLIVAWVGDASVRGEFMAGRGAVILPAVALLVVVVGLLAAWEPLRRALRVPPTEALQAE
jgi:putative ABC transport system permease protein